MVIKTGALSTAETAILNNTKYTSRTESENMADVAERIGGKSKTIGMLTKKILTTHT